MQINFRKTILSIVLACCSLHIGNTLAANTPAFPGAEGFGMYTTGGRGGTVYHVTTLTDSDEKGTLRYAIKQKGPRTIVFDVGGIIELQSRLNIANGDLTIAGQTAPGDGICIKNYELYVGANNVIIRFLRFRLGTDKPDGYDDNGNPYQDRDAAWGRNQSDIILDHCTFSWCTDECASFYDNANFTMQWCLLSESLRGSLHPKGYHGYGGIWGGHSATFHHNMIAHHDSRNPRLCGSRFCNKEDIELVDYRNNVVYNWGNTNSGYAAEGGRYNFVNNYYKSGPATNSKIKYRIFQPNADDGSNSQAKGIYGHFYVNGNYMYEKGDNWDWNGFDIDNRNNSEMTVATIKSNTEYAVTKVTTHTATTAFDKVLKLVGASLHRDAIDTRITNEAKNGTFTYTGSVLGGKGIIDSPADVGGYPTYNNGTAPQDTDGDGMPDAWENANSLNPNDASDGASLANDGSGYTNLENYMNSLVCEIMSEGLADGLTSSDYTCGGNVAADATLTKHGAGSSNQTITKGAALVPYNFTWDNAPTVSVEGTLPDGIDYNIDTDNKTISFSGNAYDNVGKYTATVKTVGGATEATYNISFTIEASNYQITKRKFDFIVGVDGDFKAAKEAAEKSSNERFYIFFPNGEYNIGTLTGDANQKTTYSRPKTSFIGQDEENVVIYNASPTEGISVSSTLYLDSKAHEAYMQDLTLQNRASIVPGAQANRFVVLQDRGNKSIFKRVKLLSTQDTYYSTSGDYRSYWEDGEIHGTVDFICGGGDVFFNRCLLYLEDRSGNVIAAPANTSAWGYVFSDCTIDGVAINNNKYRLGRSWNNKASTVYLNTTMKVLPLATGWGDPMNVVPTLFAEYNSRNANGGAVDLSQRRSSYTKDATTVSLNPVLTEAQAANYTIGNVVGGSDSWTPDNDCKQLSAPNVKVNDGVITWMDNDSALCYFVFKNNVYVTNTTQNSYAIPTTATANDVYTVRAANAMGGLGATSKSVTIDGIEETNNRFFFYYDNGTTSSPRDDENVSKWECTENGKEGFGWEITSRDDKSILYGTNITYNDHEYSTFKNSKGAQSTFYLPDGVVAKKVHFIGYSNSDQNGVLTEINGATVSLPLNATTSTQDYATHPATISYKFPSPVCKDFTFTFGTSQVCFIIALEFTEGDCDPSETVDIESDDETLFDGSPFYDVLGRPVQHLHLGEVYIHNGKRILFTEE